MRLLMLAASGMYGRSQIFCGELLAEVMKLIGGRRIFFAVQGMLHIGKDQ
jgi:hypothetical protein